MNRLLVVLGAVILALGLAWPVVKRLPLFRLPGDIVIDRPGLKIFAPLTSMVILSVVVSLLLWLFRR